MKGLVLFLFLCFSVSASGQDVSSWICDILAASNEAVKIDGKELHDENSVRLLYDTLSCSPIWYSESRLFEEGYLLIQEIKASQWDGLNPEDYAYTALKERLRGIDDVNLRLFLIPAEEIALLDILLTDAALKVGKTLRMGKVEPKELDLMWEIPRDSVNILSEFLEASAYLNKDSSPSSFVSKMRPPYPQYKALRKAYQDVSLQAEDTLDLQFEEDLILRPGDEHPAVLAVRAKMNQLYSSADSLGYSYNYLDTLSIDSVLVTRDSIGYLVERTPYYYESYCRDTFYANTDSAWILVDTFQNRIDTITVLRDTVKLEEMSYLVSADSIFKAAYYDSLLVNKVKQYQEDHQLSTDGVVGPKTLRKMTFSKKQSIKELLVNLETWKWLPRELQDRLLLVNVPGFYLDVMERDSVVEVKKVMVGTIRTKTAIFADILEYIELNPYWNVTYNIASGEMLPKIRRNPGYLAANNYELFTGGKKVNPYSVDWSTVSRSNFKYNIRQKPGRRNALGLVKFMFPNQYSIYLHDTPSKPKFALPSRALSHGCIRLQNPLDLAEYLLKDQEKWDREKIDQVIARGKNKRVNLDNPLPIYMSYQTVFVDPNGRTFFMDDVYKRNPIVAEALGL